MSLSKVGCKWQVQRLLVGSLVLGIYLVKFMPIHGAVSIEENFMKLECKAMIKKIMGENVKLCYQGYCLP